MRRLRPGSQVMWLELVGFAIIIALSWANELAGLTRLLLGGTQQNDWRESVIETLVVIVVAVPVVALTRRIVSRLHYLEGFLRICAWCKKLNRDDEWIPVEEFFQRGFETTTSHGMCAECLARVTAGLAEQGPESWRRTFPSRSSATPRACPRR